MEMDSDRIERVFSALGDANRRKIITLLHAGDSTLLKLSESFPISFQALSKHIGILEEARIVTKRKQGKYRMLSLHPAAFHEALRWISYYTDFWHGSLDQLEVRINQQAIDGSTD